ncbi:MAG: pilus (MSHA type) biogenesis protein MshL [Thiotrichaceae bacterium]|nr:pilus (MSHA type) biogenesis protein MshL [Thiotrichaceae bacterium]
MRLKKLVRDIGQFKSFGMTGIALLAACAPQPPTPSPGHLSTQNLPPTPKVNHIPTPVHQVPFVPPPQAAAPLETYTVVVNGIAVRDLLFALARDAGMNLDIHPNVTGTVTLNAIQQTLPQILERIANQVDLLYKIEGTSLSIRPDAPYLNIYKVGYVNIARESSNEMTLATQIISNVDRVNISQTGGAGGSSGSASASTSGSGENNSTTKIKNVSNNYFWQTLSNNIHAILGQATAAGAGGTTQTMSSGNNMVRSSNDVIVNPESGVLSVRATSRQHKEIQKFIDQVVRGVQRQVLIEATVAEVRLNDQYQAGVDWKRISGDYSYTQSTLAGNVASDPYYAVSYSNANSVLGNVSATVRMLEQFGSVKVLSSPKIMALNNQSAILKVVDNIVYFTFSSPTITNPTSTGGISSVNLSLENVATPRFLPVGLMMNVTPQVGDDDVITLNVRPTISRVIGFVNDPTPSLAKAGVVSRIPEIQVREVESILKVANGDIAIIGGLMQDTIDQRNDGVPTLSRLPLIGDLFSYRNDSYSKTELVIFLRPVVIKNASLNSPELRDYQRYLPDPNNPDVAPPTGLTQPQ